MLSVALNVQKLSRTGSCQQSWCFVMTLILPGNLQGCIIVTGFQLFGIGKGYMCIRSATVSSGFSYNTTYTYIKCVKIIDRLSFSAIIT